MCKILKISRTTYYYEHREKTKNSLLENTIIEIFNHNRKVYGTRKIKVELKKIDIIASRRLISQIMRKYGLISLYTIKQYKHHKTTCNEEKCENIVSRKFKDRNRLEVVVSDLTYVNVAGKWNYICCIWDLHNREIVGHSAGKHKTAELVYEALLKVKGGLHRISIFHTDRGNEFKNKLIDEVIKIFHIKRSLSRKGNPYDNAVAEAAFKIIKIEFVDEQIFGSLAELKWKLMDYINWYNNLRIHGSLNYLTPMEYKTQSLKLESKLAS